MMDGVYPIEFQGAPAYMIVWRGEPLQMYWGSEREACQHLWMLNHPDAAAEIVRAVSTESDIRFADRFEHLRSTWYHGRKVAA
jgi:hypothetical protein